MTPEGMLAVLDTEFPQLRDLKRDLRMLVLCQEAIAEERKACEKDIADMPIGLHRDQYAQAIRDRK